MANLGFVSAYDLDTGGGSERVAGVNLRISGSGASIEAKGSQTSANSIPVVIASDQGALDVSGATVTVAGTGTLAVQEDGAALTALQLIDDVVFVDDTATHSTGVTKCAGIGAVATPTDSDVTANDIGMLAMSVDRRLLVDADITASVALDVSAATVTVDLGSNNDVTTELAGTTAVAAMADDDANPTVLPIGAYMMGYDNGNTNWNRVRVDDAGHLQVDVLTGGGVDTPTNPIFDGVDGETPTNVTAGGTVDVDSIESAGKKLTQATIWMSTAYFVRLYKVEDGVQDGEPFAVGGGQPYQPFIWSTPHRDYVELATNAGLDAFRAEVTNLDDNDASDVYVVWLSED